MTEETPPSPSQWILPLIQVLTLNAVQIYGVFWAGWSWGTIVALYWCECLLSCLLVALLIVVHRKRTGKRGHWLAQFDAEPGGKLPQRRRPASFLVQYLRLSLGFVLAEGAVLALLGFLVSRTPGGALDLRALGRGLVLMLALLVGTFVLHLQGLEHRSFTWLLDLAKTVQNGPVVFLFSMLISGFAFPFVEGPRPLFGIFAVVKLLVQTGDVVPQMAVPDEIPSWLAWIGRKLKPHESWRGDWRRDRQEEKRLAAKCVAENEEVVGAGE